LVGDHEVQIDIDRNSKKIHDLIEQHAVLGCRTDGEVNATVSALQLADQRCHLDSFRSRPDHDQHVPARAAWPHDGVP
jgi:hypothetical protein